MYSSERGFSIHPPLEKCKRNGGIEDQSVCIQVKGDSQFTSGSFGSSLQSNQEGAQTTLPFQESWEGVDPRKSGKGSKCSKIKWENVLKSNGRKGWLLTGLNGDLVHWVFGHPLQPPVQWPMVEIPNVNGDYYVTLGADPTQYPIPNYKYYH